MESIGEKIQGDSFSYTNVVGNRYINTITICQFIFVAKEVKSRLHYLNEYHMNFEREILKVLLNNYLLNLV